MSLQTSAFPDPVMTVLVNNHQAAQFDFCEGDAISIIVDRQNVVGLTWSDDEYGKLLIGTWDNDGIYHRLGALEFKSPVLHIGDDDE